tara:strand:- start:694 stop:906 length:213 start_codon:yes stop_codon:yes gene_type:complete
MDTPIRPAALSIRNATQYTGLSRSTLYRMMTTGQLPSIKIGVRRLLRIEDLDALIAAASGAPLRAVSCGE